MEKTLSGPISCSLIANGTSYPVTVERVSGVAVGTAYLIVSSTATIPEHTSGVIYVSSPDPIIIDASI